MLSADTNYELFLSSCSLFRPDELQEANQEIAAPSSGHRRGRRNIVYSMHVPEVAREMGLFKSLLTQMLNLLFWR